MIKRKPEDMLLATDVAITDVSTLHPTCNAHARDRRDPAMTYRLVTANQHAEESPWWQTNAARGNCGEADLVRRRDTMTVVSPPLAWESPTETRAITGVICGVR